MPKWMRLSRKDYYGCYFPVNIAKRHISKRFWKLFWKNVGMPEMMEYY